MDNDTSAKDKQDKPFSDFLTDYEQRVQQAANLIPKPEPTDKELQWVTTPAPNAIVWCVGKEYLDNPTTFQHWRQYQVIRDFFELRCPLCNSMDAASVDCWNKTKLYLESETLLEWNRSESDDICPRCKTTRRELILDGFFKNYNQLHAVVGMRGGKTATVSIIASYIEHRLYNMHYNTDGGLAKVFGQLPGQPFEITCIASSDVQSQDTIWAHYQARRKQSPWLQRYIAWIKDIEAKRPTMRGMKPMEYRELDKEVDNPHVGIVFNSLNSNSSGLAGRTRIAAYLDELARFQNSESRLSADEAYRVLENSLETIRTMSDLYKLPGYLGAMVSISSPISIDDKSMRLYAQSGELKRMFAFKYATWEFNPFQPRERFHDQFVKDPIGARRDFGADPPNAANPLIEDPERFENSVKDVNLKPTANIVYYRKTDKMGNEYQAARCVGVDLRRDAERMIVFDAGLSFDTFGGAAAHGEWWDAPEGKVWITVFDWVLRMLPKKFPVHMDIWFQSIVDIITPINQKQRIAAVEFDRWNSAMLIQNIRDLGIRAEQRGTMVQDFIKFAADANLGHIRMLPQAESDINADPDMLSGPATAFYELERLQRSPDLRKVFNPNKGQRIGWNSDDVAQCVVHAHRMVQDQVAADTAEGARSPEARLRNEQMGGAAFGRSGSGKIVHPKTGVRGW